MDVISVSLSDFPSPEKIKSGWPWTEEIPALHQTMPNGSPWPKISIVTPSYNQAQFLEETIRSVLLQDYPNLEYIIIDGGSVDGSVEIIKKYEKWLTYWVSEKDRGQTYAIMKGMDIARGEIVNWLNADDILLPGALRALAVNYGTINQKMAVLCGHNLIIDHNGKEINRKQSYEVDLESYYLPQSPPISAGAQASVFLTRKAWDHINGIDVNLNYTMDTDLYFRAHASGVRFFVVDHFISALRLHEFTKTHAGWKESITYKRRFYFDKLKSLNEKDQKIYLPKIRRLLFGFYAGSVWPTDSFHLRLAKVLGAIRTYPQCLLEPYNLRRIYRLLFSAGC